MEKAGPRVQARDAEGLKSGSDRRVEMGERGGLKTFPMSINRIQWQMGRDCERELAQSFLGFGPNSAP